MTRKVAMYAVGLLIQQIIGSKMIFGSKHIMKIMVRYIDNEWLRDGFEFKTDSFGNYFYAEHNLTSLEKCHKTVECTPVSQSLLE